MKALPLSLLLLVSLSASAQSADAIYQQACGPKNTSFEVHQVKGNPPAEPEPGKALVYFLQKKWGGNLMTRVGMDGAWAGVIQGNSYIYASVEPGEHHVCAASMGLKNPDAEFVHFNAQAGKVYYYLVRAELIDNGGPLTMPIDPVDRDEALYLIASDPKTTATPKP
jgi:hypothetical protein